MLCKPIAIAALVAGISGTANAYDIGKLTCQNVGQLAAQMLIARQSGVPPQAYLSALNEKLPPDAKVERNLVAEIAKVVYTSDQIAALQPEQAYAVFAQNCVEGQEQDRMSGQHEDDSTGQREDDSAGQDENQSDEDGDDSQQQ
jgi:hypothetical protein